MSMNDELLDPGNWNAHGANGFQSLCTDLTSTGRLYLEKTALAIGDLAPKPGLLVYVNARKLAIPLNGLDPVLFSAIDAATHLQVAQAYLSLTMAAAVSFVEFVAKSFPFPISQIRTPAQRPFEHSSGPLSSRDFSVLIGRQGYIHSIIHDPSRDALSSITSRLQFGGNAEGSLVYVSPRELQRDLGRFLFFHNNYRSIPWLEGKTPVQKLKTFGGHGGVHTFSPYDGSQEHQPAPDDEPRRRARHATRNAQHHEVHN